MRRSRPHIALALPIWWQMLRNRSARVLHTSRWFPHVPLALLIGLIGVGELLFGVGSLRRLLTTGGHSLVTNLPVALAGSTIRGVPRAAIGVLKILVAIGLLWRWRLAWLLALLLTLATVALELSPLSNAPRGLIGFDVLVALLLLASRGGFTRATLATGTLFALTGILVTLGYGVLGSYVLGASFKPPITTLISAVYFAVVTMATVGYGDITPQTPDAQLFTVTLIVLGLVVFATSLTTIVGPLIDNRMLKFLQPKKANMKRTSHIIVIGDGPLARNAARALAARDLQVTAIRAAPADPSEPLADVVVGDGSDSAVLQSAGIDAARAVLALSDDDSFNAFVILAAKELNPAARTVAAVSHVGNTARVGRVHPDVVLALPVIGSELLAMALAGEEIRTDALVTQLLKLG